MFNLQILLKTQCQTRHNFQLSTFNIQRFLPPIPYFQFSINKNPFTYSKYYVDAESDFYYCKARYYSPRAGYFTTRDTYDLENRYGYCSGAPVSYSDPEGHIRWSSLINMLRKIFKKQTVRELESAGIRLRSESEHIVDTAAREFPGRMSSFEIEKKYVPRPPPGEKKLTPEEYKAFIRAMQYILGE